MTDTQFAEAQAQHEWVESMLGIQPALERKDLELTAQQMSAQEPFVPVEIDDAPMTLSPLESWVRNIPLADLVENRFNVKANFEESKSKLDLMNAEIVRRANVEKATILFTQDEQIEIEFNEKLQHDVTVLQQLKPLIPEEVYNAAIYQETKIETKVSGTKLNAIARKYGESIKAIIEKGSPRVRTGNPKIKITPRALTQNVTESVAA